MGVRLPLTPLISMVVVAQLAEHSDVARKVAGSIPADHPICHRGGMAYTAVLKTVEREFMQVRLLPMVLIKGVCRGWVRHFREVEQDATEKTRASRIVYLWEISALSAQSVVNSVDSEQIFTKARSIFSNFRGGKVVTSRACSAGKLWRGYFGCVAPKIPPYLFFVRRRRRCAP